MIEQFHFLRPLWLLALIPLIMFSWLLLRRSLFSRNWQSVIDPQLLPHVLIGTAEKSSRLPLILFFICGLLGITALAGPVWNQLPQPVHKAKSALVIALDLSRSMDASDIKPSRLTRAHYKVNDILKLRNEGDTALIAYAADAFTAIPLTDDGETITNIVNSLTTDIMPAQGSRADRALSRASELLRNAAIQKGHILLITDGVDSDQLDAFSDIASQGHHVSILAIGTSEGSPISLDLPAPSGSNRSEEIVSGVLALVDDAPNPAPAGAAVVSSGVAAALAELADAPGAGSVVEFAARSGLSPSRFSQRFAREVGIPMRRYRRWVRMLHAIEALSTGASLTTAAHEAGFTDSAHLTHTFRDHFGMAPSGLLATSRFEPPS